MSLKLQRGVETEFGCGFGGSQGRRPNGFGKSGSEFSGNRTRSIQPDRVVTNVSCDTLPVRPMTVWGRMLEFARLERASCSHRWKKSIFRADSTQADPNFKTEWFGLASATRTSKLSFKLCLLSPFSPSPTVPSELAQFYCGQQRKASAYVQAHSL